LLLFEATVTFVRVAAASAAFLAAVSARFFLTSSGTSSG
jgi:hypothetical protein